MQPKRGEIFIWRNSASKLSYSYFPYWNSPKVGQVEHKIDKG